MSKSSGQFTFRKNAVIGAVAAEDDSAFLNTCYIDTGDVNTLLDMQDHRRIVLGRTGSGKSALLLHLKDRSDAIWINPQTLSLSYISNSNVLQFFEAAGVNLTPFYKLLWKHVFAVELIRRHNHLDEENKARNFLARLFGIGSKSPKTKKVMEYLTRYGDTFWEGTEFRVKEIVTKVEDQLKGELGAKCGSAKFGVSGAKSLTEEQRQEVVHRGQEVVRHFQVKDLQEVMEVLADDLLDGAQHYFIIIDNLDENWVEDDIRYKLIRALIDTAREFKRVQQVKIIIGLRQDLLEAVLTATQEQGFQQEKYLNLCLHVRWTQDLLNQLVNRRVNKIARDAYTTADVKLVDLLPDRIGGQSGVQYMLGRTTGRPREMIVFFNACIARATDRP